MATTSSLKSADSPTRPAHEIRLGRIKAVIWANNTENGIRYNVTFQRLWKDGDEWRSSDSFGRDDLPLIMKVADLAHTWIYQQGQESATRAA